MDMNHDAYVALQNQLQDHFDARYRLAEDCEDRIKNEEKARAKMRGEFTEVKMEQVKTNTLLKVVIGILAAIGTALLGVCVRYLFG